MSEEDVTGVLTDAVKQHREQLRLALNRRTRALNNLTRAEKDIAELSGAIMALEDVLRRFAELEGGAEAETPTAPRATTAFASTLAGEIQLDSYS